MINIENNVYIFRRAGYIIVMNHIEDEKNHCAGLAGRLFGHRFEPRYDSEESFPDSVDANVLLQVQSMSTYSEWAAERVEAMKTGGERYVLDICVRCGNTIKRSNKVELGF